jgi:iron complex transport system substrate-binding protein
MDVKATLSRNLAVILIVASVSGCATQITAVEEISSAELITIIGQEVPLVNRVIALANGSAEIISAMGYKKILVGRDIASSDPTLESVEIVTSGHQVIPEKIISMAPDVVLIDDSTGPQSALDVLQAAGIKTILISQAWALADMDQKISEVAAAIGTDQSGRDFRKALAEKSNKVEPIATGTRIAFLYLRGTSSIYLIGGQGSGADSLISAIGATDIGAKTLSNPFNPMTSESLARLNPDVFIVMSKGLDSVGGIEGLLALPGIKQSNAGKNRAIVSVDDSLLLSFGPRTPSLISELAQSVARVLK